MQKIKDFLYYWLIRKERLEIQQEAQERGYQYGVSDTKLEYDAAKFKYHQLSDDWFVDVNEFLEIKDGIIYIGGEEMTANEIISIQEEIKYLERSRLWHIFQETLRQKAIEKAMLTSTNFEHVLAGKMMIHSLGVFKSIVATLKKQVIKT